MVATTTHLLAPLARFQNCQPSTISRDGLTPALGINLKSLVYGTHFPSLVQPALVGCLQWLDPLRLKSSPLHNTAVKS